MEPVITIPVGERTRLEGHQPVSAASQGGGVLVFVGVAFLLVGVFAVGVTSVVSRTATSPFLWIVIDVGALFICVALTLIVGGVLQMKHALRLLRAKQQHPAEPWLWDHRWEDRKSTRLNSSHSAKSRMPSSA